MLKIVKYHWVQALLTILAPLISWRMKLLISYIQNFLNCNHEPSAPHTFKLMAVLKKSQSLTIFVKMIRKRVEKIEEIRAYIKVCLPLM